jgi:hypothetical protein
LDHSDEHIRQLPVLRKDIFLRGVAPQLALRISPWVDLVHRRGCATQQDLAVNLRFETDELLRHDRPRDRRGNVAG